MKELQYGSLIRNARDIDSKKGIITFYFSDFHSVDVYGRQMNKNAFNQSIKNINKIYHLYNHNYNQVIGKPLEMATDEKGAFMVSQLTRTQLGKDILILYEDGIINEHSFGFYINESHTEKIENKEIEIVDQVKLVETSSLTQPAANPNTPTISVNMIDDIVRAGKISEGILERLDQIKIILQNGRDHKIENEMDFNILMEVIRGHKK